MMLVGNKIGDPESKTSGIDSLELCMNQEHYKSYTKKISYRYNSKGFRDDEWPEDLSDVIWCVGDSFTVGVGQPFAEIWPQLLDKKIDKRCLNLGEDGCSNDTMCLRIQEICNLYNPKIIVVMWSYLSRRRKNNEDVQYDKDSFGDQQDIANFIKNYKIVNQLDAKVINLIIPNAITRPDIVDYVLKKQFKKKSHLIHFEQLDWARDFHHFDIKTSKNICDLIAENI